MASLSFPIISQTQTQTKTPIPTLFPQIRIGITKHPQIQFHILNHNKSLKNQTHLISSASKTSSIPQLDPNPNEEEIKKEFSYRFLSETGGTVKVLVRNQNEIYKVKIEVFENSINGLILNWGTYRSDSSQLTNPNGTGTIKVPLNKISSNEYYSEIEFDSSKTPFYVSFHILNSNNSEIKTHKGTNFCVPVGTGSGDPVPLGVSFSKNGNSNFALYSRNTESVILCLYQTGTNEPSLEIELDRYINCTGDIWHISLDNNITEKYERYGYRCKGPLDLKKGGRFHMRNVLLDPYAKNICDFTPNKGKMVSFAKCLGYLNIEKNIFNWEGVKNPNLPMEKLIMYRLNVGLFTKDKSFSGLIEKIPHFEQLGINAILLEPIFSFDEKKGAYHPYHFFSPMKSFGSIHSLKNMIKSMHEKGIEVILEVSFGTTSEGNDTNPQTISFRGIDNFSYYYKNEGLNCKSRVVQTLILDCLRFWVLEYHIDGFSFVNSNYFLNPEDLNSSRNALIETIAFDPVLSKTKLIADPSSPVVPTTGDLQFPHWKRFSEMNPNFSTDVRKFLKGEGLLSNFATRLCGNGDAFFSRGPSFSLNYITKNFGFSLVDLVSFNNNSEFSYNCGEEGPADNETVLEKRLKQIRNFLFILFVSLGVPVLNMGDELGYSTGGKIAYNCRKEVNWNSVESIFCKQIMQFVKYLGELRSRMGDLFQRREFWKVENIVWRGTGDVQSEPNWRDPECKFLSMMVKPEEDLNSNSIFVCFNGSENCETVFLPEGFVWVRLVETGNPFPGFFVTGTESLCEVSGTMSYDVKSNSCVLFEAKSSTEKL